MFWAASELTFKLRIYEKRTAMKAVSNPIRLIPQTAQPIDFACPLCGTVHAAYYFSSARCKIYRCGGCGLTFSAPSASSVVDESAASKPQRTEQQHRALMSLLEGMRSGNVLVFADRDDSIVPYAERLFAFGSRFGIDLEGNLKGAVFDGVDAAGKLVADTKLMWPQTEYIKACVARAEWLF